MLVHWLVRTPNASLVKRSQFILFKLHCLLVCAQILCFYNILLLFNVREPHFNTPEKTQTMNNSAAKVGEIFREAGTAFNKLSEMTLMFEPTEDSPTGGKWSEEEVEMLRGCVNRFAVELNKISAHIKHRTITQIRTTLKKKAFEDAGIPIPPNLGRQVSSTVTSHKKVAPQVAPVPRVALVSRAAAMPLRVTTKSRAQRHPQLTPVLPPSSLGANAEVTLNMLNATENEDVDALGGDVKLEFESANDEVAT